MKKILVSLILSLVIVMIGLSSGGYSQAMAAESGTCGDNLTWVLSDSGTLTISGSGEMTNLTNSSSDAWKGKANYINSIVIKDGVTSIGDYAFEDCESLTSITIPNSVTSIGSSAFESCSSLTSITIPNSVTSIGSSAFEFCSSLTSITIPDSVTSIGSSAFYAIDFVVYNGDATGSPWDADHHCTEYDGTFYYSHNKKVLEGCSQDITKAIIPDGVVEIADGAFAYCRNLTSVTIPNSVTSIGDYAFEDCESLTSITIPNSVTSIGYGAFLDCESLTSIKIPNSVTSIGDYAFGYCYSLTSITIPDSVTSIGDYTFESCYSLTSITIPNSVTSIGSSVFEFCSSLTSIKIPNSVTSIGDDAFLGVPLIYYAGKAPGAPWGADRILSSPDAQKRIDLSGKKPVYKDTMTYTGKSVKPSVTIKGLTVGKDYTVAYSNNTKVGKASFTITGKGKYKGTIKKYFKILPKKSAVKSLTVGKKKLTVKMGSKVSATGGSTYQIRYRVKGSSKWKSVTTTSSSKTIKSLKKGKKYQVQVRAYKSVNGTKYYGAWSAVKTSNKVK